MFLYLHFIITNSSPLMLLSPSPQILYQSSQHHFNSYIPSFMSPTLHHCKLISSNASIPFTSNILRVLHHHFNSYIPSFVSPHPFTSPPNDSSPLISFSYLLPLIFYHTVLMCSSTLVYIHTKPKSFPKAPFSLFSFHILFFPYGVGQAMSLSHS